MGEGEAAAEAQVFKHHRGTKFPGEVLHLDLVLAMEGGLGQCRWYRQQLKHSMAEEQFKVGYLEAGLARGGGGPERGPDKDRRGPERWLQKGGGEQLYWPLLNKAKAAPGPLPDCLALVLCNNSCPVPSALFMLCIEQKTIKLNVWLMHMYMAGGT